MKSKRNSTACLRLLYGTIAGLLIGISALAIYLVQDRLREAKAVDTSHFSVEGEARFDGAIRIEPPIGVPDFTLTEQDGKKTSLRDLRGQFVLLTFGFTNCPDICPLTLSDFQGIEELLGESAERLAFVFVSVDGSRDSPSVLRSYFEFRELDGIIALTGDEDTVREIGAPSDSRSRSLAKRQPVPIPSITLPVRSCLIRGDAGSCASNLACQRTGSPLKYES